jgi:glycosyltransferase involved in cell wall biosynthesis
MDKCEMHHNLRMLYIGALEGRRITDTIYGLREFLDSRGPNIDLKYTIVGGQSETALQTVKNTVYELDLKEYVECTGYIPYWETGRFFKQCNVGISYIPITDYYDHQPPTKTYEYLLSGMPVIATATSANRDVITSDNGVLIPDTISGFLEGLNTIYGRRYRYEPSGIRENAAQYTWTNIARELERYLTGLDKNSIDS